ncbi:MAG: oxygen-independent coproporphyrinogen III oxidase [Thiolinea sp.]
MSVTFKPELLEKYNVQGPRYTSYPTAPEFNEDFSATDYIRHIENSNSALLPRPLALYIHIPFCHSLCYYCGCNKVVTQKKEKAQTYLDYLYREIELLAPHLAQDRLVTQIHFGGGTPNYLNTIQFREVMDVIARRFHLSFPEELEISLEIDPRYCSSEQVAELATIGINRISIGVQDYDPDVQRAINRVQSREQVDTVINSARENGITSISVDLISGLPLQTRASFADTLQQVVDSGVDRIAIYNFAYLPQRIRSQRLIAANELPELSTRLAIATDTINFLSTKGYVHIGMDHFALPTDPLAKALAENQLKRSFQGYATHADCDQLGLGVSAISHVGEAYSQNASTLPAYYASLDSKQLPVNRGISLNQDDLIRAHIIQRIMCQHQVNYEAINSRFNIDCQSYFANELQQLNTFANDGLIELGGNQFTITANGRFFLRNIAMIFDRYLVTDIVTSSNTIKFSRTL